MEPRRQLILRLLAFPTLVLTLLGLSVRPAAADVHPVRGLDAAQPAGRHHRGVGLLQGRLRLVRQPGGVVEPVVEAVVHGHGQRARRQHVLQPRAGPRQAALRHRVARLRLQRVQQRGGDVPAGVAGRTGGLQRHQHAAVGPVQRRPGHRQQRHQQDVAAVTGRRRRGRRGHDLAHRDQVALAGQTRERAGDPPVRLGPGSPAVAQLVPLAGPARARLAAAHHRHLPAGHRPGSDRGAGVLRHDRRPYRRG